MAIICDIDNTLLRNGIQPIQKTIDVINRQGQVYLITGRSEADRAKTVLALRAAKIRYITLMMNSIGPTAQEQLRSKRINASRLMGTKSITMAIDDDNMAQTMYRSLGIKSVMGPG